MSSTLELLIKARDEASAILKDVEGGADKVATKVKGIGDASDGIQGHLSGLKSALGNVAQIASGFVLGQGLLAAPGFFASAAQAAADDEQSTLKLKQAVENTGVSYDKYADQLDNTITLAQKRGFSDDAARDSLALLMAQTGDATEAQKRFALAQDLSRGSGLDLEAASKLVGKVTEENSNVFKKMGINLEAGASEAEAFGAIQAKFGGQADTFANSTAGHFAAVKIQIGELKERIGYALLPVMSALGAFLVNTVIPGLSKVGDIIEAQLKPVFLEAKQFVTAFMAVLFSDDPDVTSSGAFGAGEKFAMFVRFELIPALQEAVKFVQTDVIPVLQQIGSFILTDVLPQFIDLETTLMDIGKTAITDWLLPALVNLKADWDALWPVLRDNVIPVLKDVGQFLLDHKPIIIAVAATILLLTNPWLAVAAAIVIVLAKQQEIAAFFDDVKTRVQGVIDTVTGLPIIGTIVTTVFDGIKQTVQSAFETIKGYFQMYLDAIEGIVTLVLDLVHGDFGKFWDDLKSLVTTMFGDIVGIFQTQLDYILSMIQIALTGWVGVITDAVPLMLDAGTQLLTGLYNGASGLLTDTILPWFVGLPGQVLAAIGDLGQTLHDKGMDLLIGIRNGAIDGMGYVIAWAAGVPGAITAAIGDMFQWGVNFVKDLASGIVTGIPQYLAGAVGSVIDKLNPTNWDIPGWSPFRQAFKHAGRFIPENMALGIGEGSPALATAAGGMGPTVATGISAGRDKVRVSAADLGNATIDGYTVSTHGAWQAARDGHEDIANLIIDAILSGEGAVVDAVKGLGAAASGAATGGGGSGGGGPQATGPASTLPSGKPPGPQAEGPGHGPGSGGSNPYALLPILRRGSGFQYDINHFDALGVPAGQSLVQSIMANFASWRDFARFGLEGVFGWAASAADGLHAKLMALGGGGRGALPASFATGGKITASRPTLLQIGEDGLETATIWRGQPPAPSGGGVHFHGNITIVANNPQEFYRKLRRAPGAAA